MQMRSVTRSNCGKKAHGAPWFPMAVAPLRQQTRLTLARQLSAILKKPDAISLWPFPRIAYQKDITCQL